MKRMLMLAGLLGVLPMAHAQGSAGSAANAAVPAATPIPRTPTREEILRQAPPHVVPKVEKVYFSKIEGDPSAVYLGPVHAIRSGSLFVLSFDRRIGVPKVEFWFQGKYVEAPPVPEKKSGFSSTSENQTNVTFAYVPKKVRFSRENDVSIWHVDPKFAASELPADFKVPKSAQGKPIKLKVPAKEVPKEG